MKYNVSVKSYVSGFELGKSSDWPTGTEMRDSM